MDIQKINDFLAKHGSHTLSIEKYESSGVRVGRIVHNYDCQNEFQSNWNPEGYVLGVHPFKISALYCCGEVCK